MITLRSAAMALLACLFLQSAWGQDVRREIHFPDLPDHQTLKCDFHMHTMFSDGSVWPTVRVAEAWRQGLDAIAITDHIEYQPHKEDVPTNHNRPYDLAAGRARTHNLLLVRASEITRDTPPGHFNALFLEDCNLLETDEFLDAIQRANDQQAFVFWNHQAWKGSEKGRWLDVHTTMFDNKWLHGMEICNGDSYYPEAHQWCLEKNLTMIGGSDIHEPDLRKASTPKGHRTMTLVFAKERSLAALRAALDEGRTAVWYKDQLIGRAEILEPLFAACVQVAKPHQRSRNNLSVEIHNRCDVDIQLERRGGGGPAEIKLPANSTSLVKITTTADAPAPLEYSATNFLIGPNSGLPVSLRLAVD